MKKLLISLIVCLFTLLIAVNVYAASYIKLNMDGKTIIYRDPPVNIAIDGKKMIFDVPAIIINGRTLVPVRAVSENFGADVKWDGKLNKVTITYDGKKIELFINKNYAYINGKKITLDAPAKIINNRTMVPIRFVSEALNGKVEWDEKLRTVYIKTPKFKFAVTNVSYQNDSGKTVITVESDYRMDFIPSYLENPYRLVIDIPNSELKVQKYEIPIEANRINSVRMSQYSINPYMTRVVVDFDEKKDYTLRLSEDGKKLYVIVQGYSVDAVNVNNDQITVKTQSEDFDIYKVHDPNYLVIDIPGSYLSKDIEKGDSKIDNYFIKDMSILELKDKVRIKFDLKDKIKFEYHNENGNIVIKLNKDEADKPIIVLDAGHGGEDPGAISAQKGLKEKDLNLDITLKLKDMLVNSGYEVYLTRSEDVLPALKERADFANKIDADIFVSIHNNSHPNPMISGTQVLYFPNGFNDDLRDNYKLAEIIHKNLIHNLGTTDMGIIERPNLAVLKYTKMPAVLVEVAFLSNSQDEALLETDQFRLKAAEGIYNGIKEYFDTINLVGY